MTIPHIENFCEVRKLRVGSFFWPGVYHWIPFVALCNFVVGQIVGSFEVKNGAIVIAFWRVVVHDVQNYFYPVAMQNTDLKIC